MLPAGPPVAFAAFDCETTGLHAGEDALLQLAAVAVTSEGIREWSTLVDPGRPLELQIQRLTGITPERLAGAPSPAAALRAFRAFVGDLPLVAHNAPFDMAFVAGGLRRHRLPPLGPAVYDTLELARLLDPSAATHRLEDLARARGIDLPRAHDALGDARAAADLFAALCRELCALDPPLLRTLAHFLAGTRTPLGRLVLDCAGGLAAAALRRRALPPVLPRDRPRPAQSVEDGPDAPPVPDVAGLLAPGSPLAGRLRPFEVRPGQARMLGAVARAFASGRHLIVEAGTGTGKSLAYLLPALAWARARGEPVVVATGTVNLQEQLVEKDLPLITGSGALEGEVALLKGRAQYACLKLWEERLQGGPEGDPRDGPFLARCASWLARTATGDRAELGLYGEDEERFSGLSADAVACTGRRCPHYEGCFLFRARRAADRADVVVANHALVFADINAQGGVLPEYRYLVCDEAHHLEDEASHHLGRVVGERAVERFLRLLERASAAGRPAGLLASLRARWEPGPLLGGTAAAAGGGGSAAGTPGAEVVSHLGAATAALRAGREAAADYFAGLRVWPGPRAGGGGAPGDGRVEDGRDGGGTPQPASGPWAGGGPRGAIRFEPRPPEGADPVWDALRTAGSGFADALRRLGDALEGLAAALDDGGPEAAGEGETVSQLRTLAFQAGQMAADVRLCLDGQDGWVTWSETAQTRSGAAGAVVVRACPVDPGDLLRRLLFEAKRSVVLTSATLSVGGEFGYVRSRLGLAGGTEGERTDALMVGSPFDYRAQALLGVVKDLPPPDRARRDLPGYVAAVAPPLARLLRATRGHALILSTAHRTLQALREALKPALEPDGIACLAQGLDGSRSALAAALRRNEETVVLGAASFWEGVDLPGEALRCLVILQLPFWPPDMPLQQARQESIAARGGNPFRELQLPQAVLRFRQGFGRLIRSAEDRGVAIVCDPRLAQSRYGSAFLRSLPGPRLAVGPAPEVVARAEAWLGSDSG